mgnify:CR=1 FL=1
MILGLNKSFDKFKELKNGSIKAETKLVNFGDKTDKKNIRILKDLLEKTMFEIEMNEILNFNNINYFFA